jgi:hydrogenase maturation factor
MLNHITANVRLLIAERFPKQDLRRVVNEIARMCSKVARLGFSETPLDTEAQKPRRSIRV